MNSVGLDQAGLLREREARASGKRAFLRRQFGEAVTPAQTKFDVAFGVALPLLCFAFDPFVFRSFGGSSDGGLLERFQLFTYALAAIEMTALCVWLAARGRLGEWAYAAGALLLAGALFCYAIGLVLLPFSLIGLIMLVGALGFTPLLTGFVYLRNGVRALRLSRNALSFRTNFVGSLAVGALLVFGIAALVDAGVSRFVSASVGDVLGGRELSPATARALRCASWFTDAEFERLYRAYRGETDPPRKARLAAAFRELTGEDAEKHSVGYLD